MRAELTATREKAARLRQATEQLQKSLNRLEARIAMNGDADPADHEHA
jgi:hypothetical protein